MCSHTAAGLNTLDAHFRNIFYADFILHSSKYIWKVYFWAFDVEILKLRCIAEEPWLMALRVKKNAAWKHLFDFDIKNKVYVSQQK